MHGVCGDQVAQRHERRCPGTDVWSCPSGLGAVVPPGSSFGDDLLTAWTIWVPLQHLIRTMSCPEVTQPVLTDSGHSRRWLAIAVVPH